MTFIQDRFDMRQGLEMVAGQELDRTGQQLDMKQQGRDK
jgi:hypothetical protein